MTTQSIKDVVARGGGPSALAKKLGITSQAISQWRHAPAARVAQIEAATGIPREELRPDLFRGVTVVRSEGEGAR